MVISIDIFWIMLLLKYYCQHAVITRQRGSHRGHIDLPSAASCNDDICRDLSCSSKGFTSGTSAPHQFGVSGQCLLPFDHRRRGDVTDLTSVPGGRLI